MQIVRATTVEDLVTEVPGSVRFLIQRGLPCLVCGEPAWGTFEEFARKQGKTEEEIDILVGEMNSLHATGGV